MEALRLKEVDVARRDRRVRIDEAHGRPVCSIHLRAAELIGTLEVEWWAGVSEDHDLVSAAEGLLRQAPYLLESVVENR